MAFFSDMKYRLLVFSFNADVAGRLKIWRKLGKLLGNGLPLIVALHKIRDKSIDSLGPNNKNVLVLTEWINGLSNGERLHEVIDQWVSLEEKLLITAGEEGGNMVGAFNSVDLVITAKKRIAKAVKAAVRTPAIFGSAIVGFLLYVSFMVIPQFELLMQGRAWTGAAKLTIDIASFTRHYMWILVPIVIFFFVVISKALPKWDGSLRVKFDNFPPFSLYRLTTGSAWVISLSALINGGVRIEDALEKILDSSGPWLANRTADCLIGLRSGQSLGEALHQSGKGFPDPEVVDDLLIYSDFADFDTALSILGKDLLEDTEAKINTQAALLKSMSFAAAGVAMVLLYGGILAMQQQMTAAISGG
jgi:type II secretory pathway component PulF